MDKKVQTSLHKYNQCNTIEDQPKYMRSRSTTVDYSAGTPLGSPYSHRKKYSGQSNVHGQNQNISKSYVGDNKSKRHNSNTTTTTTTNSIQLQQLSKTDNHQVESNSVQSNQSSHLKRQNTTVIHRNTNKSKGNDSSGNNALTSVGITKLGSSNIKTKNTSSVAAVLNTKTTALSDLNTLNSSKWSRNKNEEAISDLLQRIPEIENIFDVHSRIGNGTFSTVLLGTLKKERDLAENKRRKFAIKHHIPTSHPDRIMKELQCMAKIGGTDNVVGINCCIRYNESVAFIMPYMPHDRFHDFFNKMDFGEIQYYMKNLLVALRHVHKFCVIHRDVKPSNFLYNRRKRQFLLVDFGLAQHVPSMMQANNNTNNKSSLGSYLAPIEGKRTREMDDGTLTGATLCKSIGIDSGSGVVKRIRCTGPHGDHQATTSIVDTIIANSSSNFKMPLKQLNEITGSSKSVAAISSNTNTLPLAHCSSTCMDMSFSKTCKSSGIDVGNRTSTTTTSLQKNRGIGNVVIQIPPGSSISCANTATMSGDATVNIATAMNTMDTLTPSGTSSKYNTNRNQTQILQQQQSNSKCHCYGKPNVCNICLIKKEIHASRAGTPGYRPPEVLLKYPDQTTAVDVWATGVIFLSILSSVYPFFKAPNDYVALAEMVTIFGDKTIRRTGVALDRLVTLSQRTKALDLRKLCVRFRNRHKFSSPDLLKKHQRSDGTCEVCKNCDQFFFNCLCSDTQYETEPLDEDDPFPNCTYDLLNRLLEVNPHQRITAEEALRHPFFSETNEHSEHKQKKQKD